jgi:hypothetical protein
MSKRELATMRRLQLLWATRRATKAQILRCMELERKAGLL